MDGTFLLSNSNSYRTLRHIKSGMKETRTMRNFDSNYRYDGHKLCLIFIGNFLLCMFIICQKRVTIDT